MTQYLVQATLSKSQITLSLSDYFSVVKKKHIVYVGALSRSQANSDDRQANRA